MASGVYLKAKGLNLSPNQLEVEEGSLIEASNVIIKRDNVVESRRGFKLYGDSFGTSSDVAKQLAQYKQRILRHYSSTLQFDNGSGTFTSFNGSYSETQTGLRIKSVEANGNFYFTTSEGIKKISAASGSDLSSSSGYITNAGGVKALDLTGEVTTTLGDQSSFLPADSVVAYRVVWGIKDANANLILGTPSAKVDISNSLLELTLQDFNKTLDVLDKVGQASSSCLISDKNYVGTLILPLSATATELYTNLQTLVTKIDTDIYLANDSGSGVPMNISGVAISGTTATVTMSSGAPNSYLASGSKVYLTGFSAASGTINGLQTVLTADATTFTFTTSASGAVTHTSGEIYSGTFRSITAPSAPSPTPTHDELADLQTQLESIISGLNGLTAFTSIIPTASAAYITASDFDITTSSQVTLTITIPNDITSNYFYQVYRTAVNQATGTDVLSNKSPGDEMGLVIEGFPTSAELSAKSITLVDNTPDEFRGANLYTNEISGEGILQSNDLPPFAKDINRYKNVIFYANTRTRHRKSVSLLGVSNMLTDYNGGNTPYLTITNGTTTNTYSFVSGRQEVTTVACIADTANSLNGDYFTLNTANDEKQYYVWYKTSGGANSDPAVSGRVGIKVLVDTGDSANTVAAKTNATLASYISDFTTSILTNTITVTNLDYGYCTDATNGTSGFTVTVTTQGRGENATNKEVLLSDAVSPAQAVDETARSLVRVINKNSSEIINAFYLSGSADVPGKMLFEARTLNSTPFYILANSVNTGESFNPSFAPSSTPITSISMANPTVISVASHGLTTGNQIIISGSDSTPTVDGIRTVTVTGSGTFTVPVNVTIAGTKGGWQLLSEAEISENEEKANRIYYSKLNQPEAVPLLNYFDVGAKDSQILRIFPLRDSLFVFKEDGLYRVSGEIAPFTTALFDGTCTLLAADSLSTTNNLLYGWTTEGIQAISEAGVSTISRPIDVEILKLASSQYTNFTTATWGIGYDSDNSYTVYTVQQTDDDLATIGYRYSTLTDSWTTVDKSVTCGINFNVDDKMYLGAGDTNYIEQERKSFSRYDYADREFSDSISTGSLNSTTLQLSSVTNYEIGDVVVQEQTITNYFYNNLLKKLDIDSLLGDTNYFSTLEASAGNNMSSKLDSLITKIANDSGRLSQPGATSAGTYTALSPVGSTFTQLQTAYNSLITLLNADAGVGFSNYTTSTITHNYESIIIDINRTTKRITLNLALDYIVGPITVYKAIPTSVIYAPNHMGDPLGFKHLREATIMFENRAFTSATLSFASDLLPAFIPVSFDMSGNGIFGHQVNYGDGFFGGLSNSAPFRTLIPRNVQRCRYILVKFQHNVAREQWAIYGVTITGKTGISSRAYR